MKNLLLFLLMLTCLFTRAQTIHVKVSGVTDSAVNIGYPIGEVNFAWWRNGPSKKLDATGTVTFPNTLTKAANVYLTAGKRFENVFVEPGEDMSVTIDYSGKKKILHFEGKNAEGNLLLGSLNHPFYQEKGRGYAKRDSTANEIKFAVLRDMQQELNGFDSLLKVKKITAAFYSYAALEVKYYYAAVYGAAMYNGYLRTKYPKAHPEFKASMNPEIAYAWPDVFKLFSLKDKSAIRSSEFFYYAYDYISFYKLGYLAERSGFNKNKITAENKHELRYAGFVDNFSGDALEYLLARYIFDEAMQRDFDAKLLNVFTDFTQRFPKSNYTALLSPLMTEIVAYHQKAAKAPGGQELLDRKLFSTFEDLALSFKDRTVYVDLWATWCVPCKEEFAFNPGLKAYLKSKDISTIYISMDNDDADKQWKDMMKFYDLNGYHIRVNDALKKDIINRFYDGKGYSIPRYMLIKNGKIIIDDAMRPSDKEKLYQQIGRLTEAG